MRIRADVSRLQKYLAERGVGSRRECERMIAEGRIAVNGQVVATPGARVDPEKDVVAVDGRTLSPRLERRRTILLYKPRGYVCSVSSKQGKTVCDLAGRLGERLVPVGRLDKESEGLLLMSNDGELVNRLTHPRFEHAKTYRVAVEGAVTPAALKRLGAPFLFDGYRTRPAKVRIVVSARQEPRPPQNDSGCRGRGRTSTSSVESLPPSRTERMATVLEFTLKEGRNRQIRRMCEEVGLSIRRLVRVRVGSLTVSGLKPGQWRELTPEEIRPILAASAGS